MPRILIGYGKAMLFTVERAVGRNAPNDRLDVLLVQFLLFLNTTPPPYGAVWDQLDNKPTVPRGLRVATPSFRAPTTMPNLPGTHPKPQGNIIIDGICGDQTIGFIEYFQEQMRLRVGVFEVDGQVAPQTPEAGANTIMRTLNAPVYYSLAEPRLLAQCIGFPPELMTSFFDY